MKSLETKLFLSIKPMFLFSESPKEVVLFDIFVGVGGMGSRTGSREEKTKGKSNSRDKDLELMSTGLTWEPQHGRSDDVHVWQAYHHISCGSRGIAS